MLPPAALRLLHPSLCQHAQVHRGVVGILASSAAASVAASSTMLPCTMLH
jgi:hypothetical protein